MLDDWDYSKRAKTYDERSDYSKKAINELFEKINCNKGKKVADIGAGTGKLTKILLEMSLEVIAIEPNSNMLEYGKKNTKNFDVTWLQRNAEKMDLNDNSYHAVFFGSSFNVVDTEKALKETHRILKPKGWFVCMWNHRDISNPLQKKIEDTIKLFIPNYKYGKRRQNPENIIINNNLFSNVGFIENNFIERMNKLRIINAWKSHQTLYKQSNGKFDIIIDAISKLLNDKIYNVPYSTKIWYAQKN
ncbi:methyltransferase domain-containing protein [Alphaproteobacteria bacterium]|nr:methyltransferase domain-containing protein [Alphaproteobacteria bacterium]